MPLRRPQLCRPSFALGALLLLLTSGIAHAHSAYTGVMGKQILVRTDGAPATNQFRYTAQDVQIQGYDEPTLNPSTVQVRNLAGDSNSDVIALKLEKWRENREAGTNVLLGYIYEDNDPDPRGGITLIELSDGLLVIEANGDLWPWAPEGNVSDVWVLFRIEDAFFCSEFSAASGANVTNNQVGHYAAADAAAPAACPELCGNGVKELGETCDDGNSVDDDICTNACEIVQACGSGDFDTTYEAIQSVIYDGYKCSHPACHGGPPGGLKGGLDLSAGVSFDETVNVDSVNSPLKLILPSEPAGSFLYEKVAAKTLGTPTIGPPMPTAFFEGGLTREHLEALRLWIRGGAPREGVVEGTASLLGTCLPPDTPLKLEPPPPATAGVSVQLQQTAYVLPMESETELCMGTYYDFTKTNLVNPEDQFPCPTGIGWATNNPSGLCFAYNRQLLLQDPQSHHSILHIYTGTTPVDFIDTSGKGKQFVPFTYKRNDINAVDNGVACDPLDIDPNTGFNQDCSSHIRESVACIGWGPDDASISPQFGGSQEPYQDSEFAPGVFSILPMQGVIMWNSHAFNLTETDTTMAQYYDLFIAKAEERVFPVRGIFLLGSQEPGFSPFNRIFAMSTPGDQIQPFTSKELCATWTIDHGQHRGAKLFQLNSHTHKWGVRFRIWAPPNTSCEPTDANCVPGPDERLIYESRNYTDPVQLDFDPPIFHDETAKEDRTYLYCSVFDNEETPESPHVKTKAEAVGPCTVTGQACVNHNAYYGLSCADDTECDSYEFAGDGECEQVCNVVGGVTTTDEMFILLGAWYLDDTPPEPVVVIPPPAPPVSTSPPVPAPAQIGFCGLVGLELLPVLAIARVLRRRRQS